MPLRTPLPLDSARVAWMSPSRCTRSKVLSCSAYMLPRSLRDTCFYTVDTATSPSLHPPGFH